MRAKYCSQCGQQVVEGAQFCSGCGAPLEGATTTPVYEKEQELHGSPIKWAAIVLALIVLYFTNPDEAKHKEAVDRVLSSYGFTNKSGESDPLSDFFLGIIDGLSQYKVTADNYYFFSLTRMRDIEGSRIVGIGILGHVFVKK